MERKVQDSDSIIWSCVQAFSGISDNSEAQDAAEVKGEPNTYWVVCTPSGGKQSVRLKLQGDWEKEYSDEALLEEIKAHQ